MASYDELMKLAEENSVQGHKLVQQKIREREQLEAQLNRERKKREEISEQRKRDLTKLALKNKPASINKLIPQRLPSIPSSQPEKPLLKSKPTSQKSLPPKQQNNQSRDFGKRESALNSRPDPQTNKSGFSRPVELKKSSKASDKLSFEELMNLASQTPNANHPSSSVKRPPNPSADFDKRPLNPSADIDRRLPNQLKPKVIQKPRPEQAPIRRENPRPQQKRAMSPLPSQAMKPIRQQSSSKPANVPPRKSAKPSSQAQPNRSSNLLTGSRFAKLGPVEFDSPPRKAAGAAKPIVKSRPPQHSERPRQLSQPAQQLSRPRPPVQQQERVRSVTKPSRPEPSRINRRPPSPPPKRNGASFNKRRPLHDDDLLDDNYVKNNISSVIGSLFGYDRTKYRDDFSDDDMEVTASQVRAEESRRFAREEDEREEELERQRLERIRKRKMARSRDD